MITVATVKAEASFEMSLLFVFSEFAIVSEVVFISLLARVLALSAGRSVAWGTSGGLGNRPSSGVGRSVTQGIFSFVTKGGVGGGTAQGTI